MELRAFFRVICVGVLLFAGLPDGRAVTRDRNELLVEALKKNRKQFGEIGLSGGPEATVFRLKLGKSAIRIDGGDEFDAFRFKAPGQSGKQDFVWYFNVHSDWGAWYIVPLDEEFKPGFKTWFDGDKVFAGHDVAGEGGRLRIFQTLDAGYFTPGREYVIWFMRTGGKRGDPPADLRGALVFRPGRKDWDPSSIEEALGLKSLPMADQVKSLDSRGGRMLLDRDFFSESFAEERVGSLFFSLRQTRNLPGGFFIRVDTTCPPCRTEPSYQKIAARYGPADFIRTSSEAEKLVSGRGDDASRHKNSKVVYYYDYFGFEVAGGDQDPKVLGVLVQPTDFSGLSPKGEGGEGLKFARAAMQNLVLFRRGDQEVGRLYYFMEEDKEPWCVAEPPPGIYRSEGESLEYEGKGRWNWKTYYKNGKPERQAGFLEHRMHGPSEGFYEDGGRKYSVSYEKGLLEGEAVFYTSNGEVSRRTRYHEGKPVKDSPPR